MRNTTSELMNHCYRYTIEKRCWRSCVSSITVCDLNYVKWIFPRAKKIQNIVLNGIIHVFQCQPIFTRSMDIASLNIFGVSRFICYRYSRSLCFHSILPQLIKQQQRWQRSASLIHLITFVALINTSARYTNGLRNGLLIATIHRVGSVWHLLNFNTTANLC